MINKINSLIKIIGGFLIIAFLILASARYINLTTADLGRHIINGEAINYAILHKLDLRNYTPLFKNFYSYTEPEFTVNNHHWFTGIIFAFVHRFFGFIGLSIFNIAMIVLANIFVFISTRRLAGTESAILALLLAAPLSVSRIEVRPESISYCLIGLLTLILVLYSQNQIKFTLTAVLTALIMLLWVNSHIFFAIGLFIIAAFFLGELLVQGEKTKSFFFIGLIATCTTLINPFGIKGLLEPLIIFKNFGYMLVENQSVFFMHKRFPEQILFYYFDFFALLVALGFCIRSKSRSYKQIRYSLLILSLVLGVLSFKVHRMIPVFALIAIPALAFNFQNILDKVKPKLLINVIYLIWALTLLGLNSQFKPVPLQLGLLPNVNGSAEFFKANNIQGPILNNYDIGGFLIYHLFPFRRVFVDNRPEAYSVSFFKEVYEPMQASEERWHEIDKQVNFNVIYFMRHDMTEHAQPFLIRRIADPEWVLVFVDDTTVILLKRNSLNANIIKQYELPKNIFLTVS
jgi:hypothetical protein